MRLNLQETLMRYTYTDNCCSQTAEIEYSRRKAQEELDEIQNQLEKAEHLYKKVSYS